MRDYVGLQDVLVLLNKIDRRQLDKKAWFDEARKEILNMEPADVRENVYGKWDMKPDPYGFFDEIPVCSECGLITEMRKTYNFCPNCGADMREG